MDKLTYKQVMELMDKLADSSLTELSLSGESFSLVLKKEHPNYAPAISMMPNMAPQGSGWAPPMPSEPQATQPIAVEESHNLLDITAPMVGTFYSSPSPDSPPFVSVGDRIKPGDALCIIEAMKVMNELPSEVSGVIKEICVENAQAVEFGQVLFRVDPS